MGVTATASAFEASSFSRFSRFGHGVPEVVGLVDREAGMDDQKNPVERFTDAELASKLGRAHREALDMLARTSRALFIANALVKNLDREIERLREEIERLRDLGSVSLPPGCLERPSFPTTVIVDSPISSWPVPRARMSEECRTRLEDGV